MGKSKENGGKEGDCVDDRCKDDQTHRFAANDRNEGVTT